MKRYYKEYKIEEWKNISPEIRRNIINHYWTPFDLKIGKNTRNEILSEFLKTINTDFFLCEFSYFAHYVLGIKYIPKNSTQKVPKDFYGIPINKGKVVEFFNENKILVNWRYSGRELVTIKHNLLLQ